MVAREILIDGKLFLIKQCMRGTFDSLNFTVNDRTIGSITVELALFLSLILHQASAGLVGQNVWKQKDLMLWLQIRRKTNQFGTFMEVSWAKRERYSRRTVLYIPIGPQALGWKRFAIGIDSLIPLAKNVGANIFPCADLAGRSRAHNFEGRFGHFTHIDALGAQDHFGFWKFGIICTRPSPTSDWKDVGEFLSTKANLMTSFQLLPVNGLNAILFIDEEESRSRLLQMGFFLFNNELFILNPWTPEALKPTPLSRLKDFWISFSGVPLHCWTLDTFHALAAHCGELLSIDPSSLSLEDISKINLKVRNHKGFHSIPRLINLSTVDGDFEILVTVNHFGKDSLCSPFRKIQINGVHHDNGVLRNNAELSTGGSLGQEGADLDELRCLPSYWSQHSRHLKWGLLQKRSNTNKRSKWVWIPKKIPSAPPNFLNLNSNSNVHAIVSTVGSSSSGDSILGPVPVIASSSLPPTISSSEGPLITSSEMVPSTSPTSDESTANNSLAHKRLAVGIELGLSSDMDMNQTLAMFQKSIIQDKLADALARKKIPDDFIEDFEIEEPSSPGLQVPAPSTETPIAPFVSQEPVAWWEDSQIRQDFLQDDSESIGVPPGFELAFPPPPGFETAKLRRKAVRLEIYRKEAEVETLFPEALGINMGTMSFNM